jgi:hypothetical protein
MDALLPLSGSPPFDRVVIPTEGFFPWCEQCQMQVNPPYPQHTRRKECRVGMEQRLQQELVISLVFAMQRKFTVNGSVLERNEVFKYLG